MHFFFASTCASSRLKILSASDPTQTAELTEFAGSARLRLASWIADVYNRGATGAFPFMRRRIERSASIPRWRRIARISARFTLGFAQRMNGS